MLGNLFPAGLLSSHLSTLTALGTPDLWVTPTKPVPMSPAGCPTRQLNSDTIRLETPPGPKGQGLTPLRLSPTSDANRTEQVP